MGGPEALSLSPWTALAALLITSGFAKYLIDLYREYRNRKASAPPPTPARQAEIDQSMHAMSKANERLEEENKRLRVSRDEIDALLSRERTDRATERAEHLRQIDALEQKLREMSSEISELLRQVGDLRSKHDTDPTMRAIGGGESRSAKTTEIRED